jgi:hypothetical protein
MAYYLVSATPRDAHLQDLETRLARDEFMPLQPFGRALSQSLREARRRTDRVAVWEEEIIADRRSRKNARPSWTDVLTT